MGGIGGRWTEQGKEETNFWWCHLGRFGRESGSARISVRGKGVNELNEVKRLSAGFCFSSRQPEYMSSFSLTDGKNKRNQSSYWGGIEESEQKPRREESEE